MSHQYFACVYGGASDRIADSMKQETKKLGSLLAELGYSLVYGAGASGCMGAAADGMRKTNGYIMGVLPFFMGNYESLFDCDNIITAETMAERKMIMEKHADIFLVVPGGIGTMDEFFQILTLKHLDRLSAPIVLVNLEGFYDSLLTFLSDLVSQGAADEKIFKLFQVVNHIQDERLLTLLNQIKNTTITEKNL